MGTYNMRLPSLGGPIPPSTAGKVAYGHKFKIRGNPNGQIPGSIGDSALDLNTGDEYQKVFDDLHSTGWVVESEGSVNLLSYISLDNDAAAGLEAAVAAAPAGGTILIPDGTFLLSRMVTITRDDIRINGAGVLKADFDGTTLFTITGDDIRFNGPTFDGARRVQKLIVTGDYSENWNFNEVTFKRARVTDANDPGHTASQGSATSVGIRLNKGCKHFRFAHCDFKDISFDGVKPYLGGVGRVSRAIHGAPFPEATTEADAVQDVVIIDCRFINEQEDKGKIDNDALVFQNVDREAVPDCGIVAIDCFCDYWGWRFFKGDVSGCQVINNRIRSRTVAAAGVGVCMRSAIECFGSNSIISKSFVYGGSIEHPINLYTSAVTGDRCTDGVITDNVIQLDPASASATYSIFLRSVLRATVTGNIVNYGDRGIHVRGLCEQCVISNNVIRGTGLAGILVTTENDAGDPYEGENPTQCTLIGNICQDATQYGILVSVGASDINVIGTQGNAGTALVVIGAGVTGEHGLNPGAAAAPFTALSPFQVNAATGGVYEFQAIVANSATDSIVFQDQSENKFLRWDAGTLNLLIGNTSGNNVLAGITRLVARKTTYATITYAASINVSMIGNETQQVTQSGAMTIVITNPQIGSRARLQITGDGNALTWPSAVVVGDALPASVAAGKLALFEFESKDTVAANTVIRFLGVQA